MLTSWHCYFFLASAEKIQYHMNLILSKLEKKSKEKMSAGILNCCISIKNALSFARKTQDFLQGAQKLFVIKGIRYLQKVLSLCYNHQNLKRMRLKIDFSKNCFLKLTLVLNLLNHSVFVMYIQIGPTKTAPLLNRSHWNESTLNRHKIQ